MDIPNFLILALELETHLAGLYEHIAEIAGDPPTAIRLKTIAGEEVNHANAIRRGQTYYEEFPDLFTDVTMDDDEAWTGLIEVKIFRASLDRMKIPLVDCLKKLADFERRFERVHMGVSLKIADPTLKKLFSSLSTADQSHILVLKTLIESIG